MVKRKKTGRVGQIIVSHESECGVVAAAAALVVELVVVLGEG